MLVAATRWLRRIQPAMRISIDVFTPAGVRAVSIEAPWAIP